MAKYSRKKLSKLCTNCEERPALFLSPSKNKYIFRNDGHDLCQECRTNFENKFRMKETINKYSRRYTCKSCQNKGRASREIADTGRIHCPQCGTVNEAARIYE